MSYIETYRIGDTIIKMFQQYRTIVGHVETMFDIARLRTDEETWRHDGVGSCLLISSKKASEKGLIGPGGEYLIELREQENQETEGYSQLTLCPYHRTGQGCILNKSNLKAPICIRYFENEEEWIERFGIDTVELREEIGDTLVRILKGHYLKSPFLLDKFSQRIDAVTERVKQEPVLYRDNIQDQIRLIWRKIRGIPPKL
ncbi:hypothetical protein A3I48_00575 [Candidatus Daviesbacteria bacterium RIFCSPLOWO2_02_FULL_36_7]|uniref:Uncharacterized protein n=1 Tax=Candidatus Daviesbacteria bacterium RIFCSPLOWO2_02_FULL_36_7 TaxID=1797792 RepID=A0A1F5MH10_9BACT|nr:MAG: hypothetical protein A3I48_00575 [Candidatus Daviesbacteria bacterium RIFCSPLOWO2_02_FULL_36_7]